MATAREVEKQTKKATNTRVLAQLKLSLHLSDLQKQLVFGTILGDGCLITSRSGKSAQLQIRHNVNYGEYVKWKYSFFQKWVLTPPREDHFNNSLYFRTVCHPELMEIKRNFYLRAKRFVPNDISQFLKTPLSLAVWLMDDGNGDKRRKCFRISSYGFGFEGNLLLQECLNKNFSLLTRIYHDSKGSYLWFPKNSALDLYDIVKDHILPCMRYKFSSLTP